MSNIVYEGDNAVRMSMGDGSPVRIVVNPQNSSGGGSAGYNHVQSTPSATWTINHNLGFMPNVSVFTSGGVEVLANITVTTTQAIITMLSAITGYARCS